MVGKNNIENYKDRFQENGLYMVEKSLFKIILITLYGKTHVYRKLFTLL